jgi:hypothetical protein
VVNHRSNRYLHNLVRRRSSEHFLPHTVAAALCLDNRFVKKVCEIVDVRISFQNDIAAAPAIAAVRTAFRHKFLPPETDGPAAAVSGLGKNFDSIDEHRRR